MEVEPTLIKTAGQLRTGSIQRVLRGTEVWDEGGMTSDEAGSTPRPLTRAQGNKAAVSQRRSESKEQTSRTTER